MVRNNHARLAFDDDIDYNQYRDIKAEQMKRNKEGKFSNRKLSPKVLFNLMNAIEAVQSTEESMFVSEETRQALEHLMPDSDGIEELFMFMHRGNDEEKHYRLNYKDKYGKNPSKEEQKTKRLYYLPRVLEKRTPKS